MTVLLDSNVLIALALTDHVHHETAARWFTDRRTTFATCPITQGALVRLVVRAPGGSFGYAVELLRAVTAVEHHEFWPDDLSYADVASTGIVGHRQVTDAYLAALARRHGAMLATFDKGLAALHEDVAALVPVGE